VRPNGKISKGFLLLWAGAVMWIYIGSLVNFHQHKIWGKALLPELLYAKRDKEQTVDYAKLLKPGFSKDTSFDSFPTVLGIVSPENISFNPVSGSTPIVDKPVNPLVEPIIFSSGPRGPPLA
jgi:hypothetical protein